MKKLIFTCLLFLFFANITKAQFVEIPDSNFRNALMATNAFCFNASNQMDTTCSLIGLFVELDVSSKMIGSLEGIQYLKNLKELNCSYNQLTSLPSLPSSLTNLNCIWNQLSSLPSLPSSINGLVCFNNQLRSLPSLPSSLNYLNCENNQITSLPSLPSSLVVLECGLNQLTGLPILPSSLQRLYCFGNQLTSLPSLPSSLGAIWIQNNQLSSLPSLPSSLRLLHCYGNKLSSLPSLPSSLGELNCSENQLSSLPSLPSSLRVLYCSNNQLSSLPSLPSSLQRLYCFGNQLTNLPSLPSFLFGLNCANNPLNCLPILPNRLDELYVKGAYILPICTNPSDICQVNAFAKGLVYNDANNNGIFDSITETIISNQIINVSPNEWKGISDINGTYLVKLDTAINNTWSCNTTYKYATITPNSYSATPDSLGLLPNNYNFGIHFTPNVKDLEATLAGTAVRPGFTTNIGVTANNIGTVNQSNITIKLKKPADYNVIATSIPPTSNLNDTLFWENVSIDFLQKQSFYVELQVPVSAVLGTEIVYEAWVNGIQGDTTPIDNYAKWTEIVRGSFDPNDKLVSKTTLPPAYDVEKDRLIYTIRFQNTGTDTAFYVRVKDEMPANLNLSTLRVINASHAYQLIVREKNIVEFTFPNINFYPTKPPTNPNHMVLYNSPFSQKQVCL
jgi:Leucine-rich repeat (LRR) protein